MPSKRQTVSRSVEEGRQYLRGFIDFAKTEVGWGGPDAHLRIVGEGLDSSLSTFERVWCLACYIMIYTVASAAVVWETWPLERVLKEPQALEAWLQEHWAGITVRTERRVVNSPRHLAKGLYELATWLTCNSLEWLTYDQAWTAVRSIPTFGRYASMKFIEACHRYALDAPSAYDIRAAGAWSPRLMLSYILPEHDDVLNSTSGRPEVTAQAEDLAALVKQQVDQEIPLTYFEYEVLLCNYRQAIKHSRYVGWILDSELDRYNKTVAHFTQLPRLDFVGVRKRLFPQELLGEVNGWAGVRKELEELPQLHGYVWSDLKYDYSKTVDLAQPVRRV